MEDTISNTRKITHIITGLNVGGAERALHTLLTGGLEGPFCNHVISLLDEGHYGLLLRKAGIGVTCLNMRMGRPDLNAFRGLRKLLRHQAPQIVQGWMYHGNMAASLGVLGMRPAPPVAWNVRMSFSGFQEQSRSTRALIRLSRWISKRPSALLYNSIRSREQHEDMGYARSNGRVIPNGFDTSLWSPNADDRARIRAALGVESDTVVLGFVGRHYPDKDVGNLLRALAPVMQSNKAVCAVLVGRGIDRQGRELGPLLNQLPDGRVHLLGQRDDIPSVMRAFDLLCLPSRSEGFPNVVGEAMSSAVPCVVTDVGDAAQITGDTGWVVPPRDPEALAGALAKAVTLSDTERQGRGVAARNRIIQHYSLDSVVLQYQNFYASIMEQL